MTSAENNNDGRMSPQELEALRKLARSRPRSGRGQLAKASALRVLERLNRGAEAKSDPPPMPEGWHAAPGSEWEMLDEPRVREFWWRSLHDEGRL